MGKYDDVIERLEKADGPSRELDAVIYCAINGYYFVMWDGAGCVYRETPDGDIRHAQSELVKNVSRSLDAAIALTEKLLPGWTYAITEIPLPLMLDGDKRFMVDLTGPVSFARGEYGQPEEPVYETAAGQAMVAPIAILIASFRALQAQDRE